MSRSFNGNDSLSDVKAYLRENIQDGANCPACNQYVHIARDNIGAKQALWLIRLVQQFERTGSWISITDMEKIAPQRNGDYAKLRHRGLIEKYDWNLDRSKGSSGKWRPTSKGIAFAKGSISVPKYLYIYNRKPVSVGGSHLGGSLVSINDCLRKKFDFQSLWINHSEPNDQNTRLV